MTAIRLRHLVKVGPRPIIAHLPSKDARVTFAPMDALADGLGGLDMSLTRPLGEVASGNYNFFADGDLLLAKVTPCFENGKKAFAKGLTNGIGFATSEVHVIRPDARRIDPRYLFYVLSAEDFRAAGMASMTGAGGLRRVSEAAMLNYRPCVTDLPTQTAIANFLDRETDRIDQLIEKKQRLVERLTEREKAILHALFSQSEARRWRTRHLGKLKNGVGFPVELQGDPNQDIAFFKVKHLKTFGLDATITETEDTVSLETAKQLRATIFPAGTIVFAKIGAALLLGRFSMIGQPACLDNNMAAFIPNNRLIDPHFCLLALSQINMATMVQPGAVPSLSTEAFNSYEVPLPSMESQRELVARFRKSRMALSGISEVANKSLERLREFRAALITAAVTGQIDVAIWGSRGVTDRRLDEIQEVMRA